MVRMCLNTVLAAAALLGSGCARWQDKQPANYVTVPADTGHDTAEARKNYNAARKLMQKHLSGKECDFAGAEKKLQEALTADVRFGPAHHSLGVLYFWQKKHYLAAWEFEYAARLMPDRFEPLNNLGLVYESAGKYEQAKTFYGLAREKTRNNPDVIANLARASYRSGTKVDEMRPLLEDVLATNPQPEWQRWAAELMGMNPPSSLTVSPETIDSVLSQPESESQSVEELPLIAPPAPDARVPVLLPAVPLSLPSEPSILPEFELGTSR
jgi:Tfp pilus assembly protein PilF